jgi:hypothetical protein
MWRGAGATRRRGLARALAQRKVELVVERATYRLAAGLPVSNRALAGDVGREVLLVEERQALENVLAKLAYGAAQVKMVPAFGKSRR